MLNVFFDEGATLLGKPARHPLPPPNHHHPHFTFHVSSPSFAVCVCVFVCRGGSPERALTRGRSLFTPADFFLFPLMGGDLAQTQNFFQSSCSGWVSFSLSFFHLFYRFVNAFPPYGSLLFLGHDPTDPFLVFLFVLPAARRARRREPHGARGAIDNSRRIGKRGLCVGHARFRGPGAPRFEGWKVSIRPLVKRGLNRRRAAPPAGLFAGDL